MRLFVATKNPGKLRDFANAAQGQLRARQPVVVEPLPGLDGIRAPEEVGLTFSANAVAKALYYSGRARGRMVLADDSGLEVDALKGQPGVRSARFADDMGFELESGAPVDERNNACLLSLMGRETFALRTARYHCFLALACDGQVLAIGEGTVEGRILGAPRGAHGFGYDPLFYVLERDMTMAELNPEARLSVSHRGRALRNLLEKL